jgi:hypothetical protein
VKALGCSENVTIAPPEYGDLFVIVPKEKEGATLVKLKY